MTSTRQTVVALLHPGAMGARIGAEMVGAGHQVRWLSTGRSAATRSRAEEAGLVAAPDVSALLDGADVVLSVCPPQGALEVARLVAGARFGGTFVDANPVAPATLAAIAQAVEDAGATFVDGGIVGPPPRAGLRTHLYLAGSPDRTARLVDLFAGTAVDPVVVGTEPGAASAAKQAYALFNKGRMVLAAVATELAEAHGVLPVLAGESDRAGAELLGELSAVRAGLAEVGWRWGPEFEQIGATLAAADIDPALARACEQALRRLGA